MKYLKRYLILQFLFLFVIPIAFGEISITLLENDLYNLGEKLVPTITIKVDESYDGFFNLRISCDDYNLQYYTIPLSLEANFRTQLTIPDLPLSKSMVTKCRLKSNFEATDGENVDSAFSEYFFVTDDLNIVIDENLEAKPGKDVLISGEIKKANNEFLSRGKAEITFRDKKDEINVTSGKLEHTIHLSDDIETGNIPITVAVSDKHGNYGEKILSLKVVAIPTTIENLFENDKLMTGDTLKVRVVLYDHNHHVISGSKINVKILNYEEKLIAENDIQSGNYLEFKIEETQIPGTYYLLSSFETIKVQNSFTVGEVREIIMKQEDNFVHIENVGNVEYDDEVTIVLESDDNKYLINKKIDLEPQEKITIDLSKEVPQGTYDIILPEETISSEENVIKDIPIADNRPILKKTFDGISTITGAVVGAAGYVASRPTLATVILLLIILGTVAHYSKDFIIKKIKGKKEDDTSNLFDDFKFEEEKK